MKRILVLGATSAIAEHCARRWAARGDALHLVARDAGRLAAVAADLRTRGAARVGTACADLDLTDGHAALLDAAERGLGGLDVVLVAFGVLPDQRACERSVDLALSSVRTNALSVIALLTLVAERLEQRGAGTIAVISSVAGDRGRADNYVYGCAKALVSAFASGLRQRLHQAGVSVLTVKPGFVDTPMTAHLPKGALWAQPAAVAAAITAAIDRRADVVYVPAFWRAVMALVKAVPETAFKRLRR